LCLTDLEVDENLKFRFFCATNKSKCSKWNKRQIFIHFCLFVCNRGDTIQYHGGLWSRELGQAPMLLVFLSPRQALSSHPRQQMVWLCRLQDRDSVHIVYYQPSYNTQTLQFQTEFLNAPYFYPQCPATDNFFDIRKWRNNQTGSTIPVPSVEPV
jgi:hypothetical protein